VYVWSSTSPPPRQYSWYSGRARRCRYVREQHRYSRVRICLSCRFTRVEHVLYIPLGIPHMHWTPLTNDILPDTMPYSRRVTSPHIPSASPVAIAIHLGVPHAAIPDPGSSASLVQTRLGEDFLYSPVSATPHESASERNSRV
jgi:hypothetical protein